VLAVGTNSAEWLGGLAEIGLPGRLRLFDGNGCHGFLKRMVVQAD
jgi:hypothetical protein